MQQTTACTQAHLLVCPLPHLCHHPIQRQKITCEERASNFDPSTGDSLFIETFHSEQLVF